MPRPTNRLSDRAIRNLTGPKLHADGGNLYLQVAAAGTKSWAFIYKYEGRRRQMGLGSYPDISLAKARERAADARKLVAEGIDPLGRKAEAQTVATPTFGLVAEDLLVASLPGFANDKHKQQWRLHLREYAKPLWGLAVDIISPDDVLKVLKPIWTEKPETASRVRARIEKVLAAAKARGLRTGENPAAWKENLEFRLAPRGSAGRDHHSAMPYGEVPAFVAQLRDKDSLSARALEWTILTACRTNETIGATWSEIDQKQRAWIIPASRMKANREHWIPLTTRMLAILDKLPTSNGRLFPLSNMAMLELLKGMRADPNDRKKGLYTVHGFRSSFRDWGGNETNIPREVLEGCLAHQLADRVEAAYRRGQAVAKQRLALEEWETFLSSGALVATE